MPRRLTHRQELPRLPAVKKGSDQRYKQIYLTTFYDQTKEHRLVGVTRKNHREYYHDAMPDAMRGGTREWEIQAPLG